MDKALLDELERVVVARDRLLAKAFQRGLSEARVRRALGRARVTGDIDVLIALYTWRDGTTLLPVDDPKAKAGEFALARPVFFPGQPYYFMALEEGVLDFRSFKGYATGVLAGQEYRHVPYMSEAVGRYFPVFSNFSTGSLCLDLLPSNHNRVMIVDFDLDGILVAYNSFEDFMADAIRANREGCGLTCFEAINRKLVESLGREIATRNPALSERLRPGLSEAEVRKTLADAGIRGRIEALVVLYTWRDGESLGPKVTASDTAFVRILSESYRFLSLRQAIDTFEEHKGVAADLETLGAPEKKQRVGDIRRYFPVLSDDGGRFLAIDLAEAGNGVGVIDFKLGTAREAYPSFDKFLRDGILHDFLCVLPVEDIGTLFAGSASSSGRITAEAALEDASTVQEPRRGRRVSKRPEKQISKSKKSALSKSRQKQLSRSRQLLEKLARTLASRRPALSERLRPGLGEAEVNRILADAGVQGNIEALVALYTWRNGALWGEPPFFPQSAYQFLSLQEAIENFEGNKSAASDLVETLGIPAESVGDVGRYFPVFADGGGGFLEIDLDWEGRNGVAEFDFEGGPPREVYPSFGEFLRDAIRSNQEDDALRFFWEFEDGEE